MFVGEHPQTTHRREPPLELKYHEFLLEFMATFLIHCFWRRANKISNGFLKTIGRFGLTFKVPRNRDKDCVGSLAQMERKHETNQKKLIRKPKTPRAGWLPRDDDRRGCRRPNQ